MNYDRIIRKIRNSDLLFDSDDNHKIHRILQKAQEMNRKQNTKVRKVGPYSGLTRSELAQSGTCETDWF